MNENEEQIKEQMKQYGVELTVNPGPLFSIMDDVLHVECDLDINLGLDWVNNAVLTKITKRNTKMFCTFEQKPETLTIRFSAILPKSFKETYKPIHGKQMLTTFPDLCWLYAEGTTVTSLTEVETKQREEILPGDLLWHLPSRFADDFIEMVHSINPEFMSGLMREAIVYGPYYNF